MRIFSSKKLYKNFIIFYFLVFSNYEVKPNQQHGKLLQSFGKVNTRRENIEYHLQNETTMA